MAMLVQNINGHIQNQLTRSLEKILDDANQSGELKLSNRKLKDFPKTSEKYNLSDTVIADLSKNRFSELPDEVTAFHFLEKLQCYHNSIRYIPDTIVNLQCLIFLDLSRNQLTSLPRELCQLPIKILLVSNNNLAYLPDELCRMSQLTELDASCNQLTHLPPRLNDLKNLQSLVLRNNLLLAVPIEVTFLKLLRLDLRANRIGILPTEVRYMASLIDLMVDDNPLTSPPASLCKRGRVHIFKFLENEAVKLDKKTGATTGGTLGRRSRKTGGCSSPGPPLLSDRLKHKRQNVDSGYSTSSDGFDKRWSQEITGDGDKTWMSTPVLTRSEMNGTHSILSTPSTISPAPESNADEDYDRQDGDSNKTHNSFRLSPCIDPSGVSNGNEVEEKSKPLHQIQTYREYKEALKQQRAHDVPAIYRTKDPEDQYNKTEPNTPTHQSTYSSLATSKSDPTPLNSVLSGAKYVFDDSKKTEMGSGSSPYRSPASYSPNHILYNGNGLEGNKNNSKYIQQQHQDYIKPQSPVKGKSGIMSHDNVPNVNGVGVKPGLNGVAKTNRNITWNKDVPSEKMTFTMRREIDKAREETDLINQLRNIIETRLKMALPQDLSSSLTDGVVLCHLANHIKPRSVASIHVPSPAVPKLTMARCRRNVDNFIEACRKIGVDENMVCCASDVLEGRGLVQVAITVMELLRFHSPRSPLHANSISTVV